MSDVDRLIAAANALADVMDRPSQSKNGWYHYNWDRIDEALECYRAALAAFDKGGKNE
jgi:hypothetical protein